MLELSACGHDRWCTNVRSYARARELACHAEASHASAFTTCVRVRCAFMHAADVPHINTHKYIKYILKCTVYIYYSRIVRVLL